jgi:hypothetical protein
MTWNAKGLTGAAHALRLVLVAVTLLGGGNALAVKCYEPAGVQNCQMSDGCSGQRYCDYSQGDAWGYWSECLYKEGSTRTCTACTSGRQACMVDGVGNVSYSLCQPLTATAEASTCDQCDSDKNGVLERSCSQCGGGKQQCDWANNPVGTCQPPTASAEVCDACDNNKNGLVDEDLTMTCSMGNGCGGRQSCSNGAWSGCGCDGVQRTVTCGQSACGTTRTMACDSSCNPVTLCVAEEVCNGCDDDGSGVADDYVVCSAQCAP